MTPILVLLLMRSGDVKTVRKEIQARYDALDRGFRKKDPSVFANLMTEDFTTESPDGKPLGREAAISAFEGLMMGAQHAKWPRKIVKLTLNGSEAIAIISGHFEGGLPGPDGKPHDTELLSTVEDTWTHTAHGWEIRRSHTVNMSMKRDGELIPATVSGHQNRELQGDLVDDVLPHQPLPLTWGTINVAALRPPSILVTMAAKRFSTPQPEPDAAASTWKLLEQGKYLAALDTIEAAAGKGGGDATEMAEALALARAEVGQTIPALQALDNASFSAYPKGARVQTLSSSPLDHARQLPAISAIAEAARTRQIVILNEMHHVPMHRAFALQVAQALRKEGFRYFAVEALQGDASRLQARGFPTLADGDYVYEPLFGDLIRQAIKIGYVPVAFEMTGRPHSTDFFLMNQERESQQAQNIVDRILRRDPHAKIFVYVGYQHVSKASANLQDGKVARYMAYYLKERTGIDPLCIDQQCGTERTAPLLELPEYRYADARGWLDRSKVFRLGKGNYFVAGQYVNGVDMLVFHPRERLVGGRPAWLSMSGYRRPFPIDSAFRPKAGRTLVQAFVEGEGVDAIPMDQVIVEAGKPVANLMLPAGRYRLTSQAESGEPIITEHVEVGGKASN